MAWASAALCCGWRVCARALVLLAQQDRRQRVCAQVSPGPGWERDGGPYEGPMCQPRRRVFVIPMR